MVKYLIFSVLFLGLGVLGLVTHNDTVLLLGVVSSNVYTVGNMLRTDMLINKKENNK